AVARSGRGAGRARFGLGEPATRRRHAVAGRTAAALRGCDRVRRGGRGLELCGVAFADVVDVAGPARAGAVDAARGAHFGARAGALAAAARRVPDPGGGGTAAGARAGAGVAWFPGRSEAGG